MHTLQVQMKALFFPAFYLTGRIFCCCAHLMYLECWTEISNSEAHFSIVGIGGNRCNSMFGRHMTGCSWAGEVVILQLKKVCFDFQSFTLEIHGVAWRGRSCPGGGH
jgi:hypothetical protein